MFFYFIARIMHLSIKFINAFFQYHLLDSNILQCIHYVVTQIFNLCLVFENTRELDEKMVDSFFLILVTQKIKV